MLYILRLIEILHSNALWTPKLINVKQKYSRISRNYTKMTQELNYKIIMKITIVFQKEKKNINDSKWFSQMDRRIIKITYVISYTWIETWVAKSSHKSKARTRNIEKKINKST